MAQRKMSVRATTYSAICVVINVVLGTVVSRMQIPLLFLDTIGTIFAGAVLGPWYGALVGLVTNLVVGVMTNPKDIPFALVNITVGLIVGFITKKRKFDLPTSVVTGLLLAVVSPLIGTPIAVWIYGGLTGGGMDFLYAWLRQSGSSIFTAAFLPRVTGNLIDKVVSCVLVSILVAALPKDMIHKLRSMDAR